MAAGGAGRGHTAAFVAEAQWVLDRHPGAAAWLTDVERARAARFTSPAARTSFVAAHVLVRLAASRLVSAPPSDLVLQQTCGECGGPHGKPVLGAASDVHVSLSHTDGWVAAAASTSPVGIDVEARTPGPGHGTVLGTAFTADEQRVLQSSPSPLLDLLRCWTRKEALVKVGAASLDSLACVDLSAQASAAVVRWEKWWLVTHLHTRYVATVVSGDTSPATVLGLDRPS